MKIIYISGKITGLSKEDYQAMFDNAKVEIVQMFDKFRDVQVICPTEIAGEVESKIDSPTWEDYMKPCVRQITHCTHIYMLKNWEDSRGAKIEHNLAKDLEITVIYQK